MRVDNRTGSKELVPDLKLLGVHVELERLEAADFSLDGNGPKGEIHIGVERKTISDLVDSIKTKRFVDHQLGDMVVLYDRCYLVIEGIWGVGSEGELEVYDRRIRGFREHRYQGQRKGFLFSSVANFLESMREFYGFRVIYSSNRKQTAWYLSCLESYWSKDYSQHSSHRGVQAGVTPSGYWRPNDYHKAAAGLRGIGEEYCQAVVNKFGHPHSWVNAGVEEWASLTNGKTKFGKARAEKMVNFLRGNKA